MICTYGLDMKFVSMENNEVKEMQTITAKNDRENFVSELSNGQLITNQYTSGWNVTDFIPCGKNDHVFVAKTNGTALCACCLYDADKAFVGSLFAPSATAFDFYITNPNVNPFNFEFRLLNQSYNL